MPRLKLHAGDHVIGSADTASVQLVTYGDYQCPYTARGVAHVAELLERLEDALLYVFRNFPLPIHLHAFSASLAAEAADRQGKFWDMHLRLFRHQHELDDASLLGHALALGLDEERFLRDFGDERTRARVKSDQSSGGQLQVTSTPTFFVNGRKFDGPVDGIVALVEEEVSATTSPGG